MSSTPTSGRRLFCRRKGQKRTYYTQDQAMQVLRRLSSIAPAAGLGVPGDAAARRLIVILTGQSRITWGQNAAWRPPAAKQTLLRRRQPPLAGPILARAFFGI